MPKDRKYGDVILEHGDIPDDEPVFILRGRDLLTLDTIKSYHTLCVGVNTPQQHLDQILLTFQVIEKWQHENPDKVRRPDSQSYLDRISDSFGR